MSSTASHIHSSTISLEDVPLNSFHKKLTVYSAGAPFLDGYILSIIGIIILPMTSALNLNNNELGLIAAASLVGMFLGGFIGGVAADKFGRKILYLLVLVILSLFSLFQFWVASAWSLILLRLVLGMAIGADHPLALSLLAEFLPRKPRGTILASLVMVWFAGASMAYICGELILRFMGEDGWRYALASAVVPGILFLLMRAGTPESARWLISKGRHAEAEAVIKKVYGAEYGLQNLPEQKPERHVSLWELFYSGYGRRTFFVSVFWTCAIIPIFAIYSFAPRILQTLGITDDMAAMGSIAITIFFVIGCLAGTFLCNPMGRRNMLIHSFLWSGVALALLGTFPESSALVVLGLFSLYAITIGGAQVLEYVYPNELFPTEVRGAAVGLATSLSRIGAAVGTYLIPISLDNYGIGTTMYVAAGVSIVGCMVAFIMAPETRYMNLRQAAALS